MAYTKEGFLGNFSGKLSNTVAYEFYGKTVIRSRPSGKRRPAEGALKQAQTDFSRVMKVMQAARSAVRVSFRDVAEGRSAFNTAMSVNLVNYRKAANPGDLRWLVISQGERAGAQDVAMEIVGNKVTVTWGEPEAGKPYHRNDQVMLLAINDKTLAETDNVQAARRSDHSAQILVPPVKDGENLLVFIAFHNPLEAADQKSPKNVSMSQLVP